MRFLSLFLILLFLILSIFLFFFIKRENYSSNIHRIFYINLDKRTDRKEQIESELKKYFYDKPIKRISAFLTEENGAIGCLKSHIEMLKYSIQNHPDENILFCEDDLEFIEDPRPYIDKINNKWDVVMLAHNTYKSEKVDDNILRVLDSQTGSAYLVSGQYIPTLLNNFEKAYQQYENRGTWKQEYCNDQCWKELQKNDNWFTFSKRIAKQRKSYSDIQKGVVNYEL